MGLVASLAESFGLGLATPLSAVCVIPLYPGFLAFLSRQGEDAPSVAQLGALVALGVLTFMALLGLVFTTVLTTGLTPVVGVVSPVAFALLGLFSVALIADLHPQSRLPSFEAPTTGRPSLSAFGYGFFFGAIVLPCNPGFIAVFLSRALLFSTPLTSVGNFLAFGAGMAAPLVGLAAVSEALRSRVLAALTGHRRGVEVVTGVVMLAISVYYLVVVFEVVPFL